MKNKHDRSRLKCQSTDKDYLDLKVGQTPRKLIWRLNKATLWYYPSQAKKFKTPLLLVYSLVNKSYILDLHPGMSMIEAYLKEGYDVYLLDFGEPGYEDKNLTLDDYILKYMDRAVKRTLLHSNAGEISLIGYCLGGTLTAIYAAIAETPIKNLIIFATPIDFSKLNIPPDWKNALQKNEFELDEIIDEYGIIPAKVVENAITLATTPFTIKSKLSLKKKPKNLKMKLLYHWINDQIAFSGALLKQLIKMVLGNQLVHDELEIGGKKVRIANIKANTLVISTTHDELVPEKYTKTIMSLLTCKDQTFERINGGHVTIAMTGKIPHVLKEWLMNRSTPL
ncbi:alpha/beta fold hydrolase [Alkalihalobacterium sp. APHAB7]|uniref:alpha/beta fold hydrolase n=1 Tax=Alkalihalobacterium sp. APHAB7 TaxID=3402081 RepID=UPI003AB075E9